VPGSLAYRLFSRPALGAGLVALRQTFVRRCHGGLGSFRARRVLQFAGFFILSQLPAWAKKAPRTYRKRGAGPLSDRQSRSIIRLSKDQGGSSVLLDTPVVICAFNRRQYNFVIRPIPVFYAQAAD
jgi:hypothetical protein